MIPTEINVMECEGFGPPEVLKPGVRLTPNLGKRDVLIKVAAAGVNRADVLQRKGKYPPPPGVSDIPGLEVAGTVVAIGYGVKRWREGDRVCALLAGGGYADHVVALDDHCLPVPELLNLTEAAALPEAIVTAYANLFEDGALQPGEIALIHGGASGVGTLAIQMAVRFGAKVFTTAGTAEKCQACRALGADMAINYTSQDFVDLIKTSTGDRGVDVVLDMVGGDYIARNLSIMAPGGRHVSIAAQKGRKVEIDILTVMQRHLTVTGSTLRNRDRAEKARLIASVEEKIWPYIATGQIKPVVFRTFGLKNAAEAHKVMESGEQIGKIVLEVS